MNVELIGRLLHVASSRTREAAMKDLSALRRLQAAVDSVVFFETATQLAMEIDGSGSVPDKAFTALFGPPHDSIAREINDLRQMYRQSSCDGTGTVKDEDVDVAIGTAMRVQARVMGWFRGGAIPVFADIQMQFSNKPDSTRAVIHLRRDSRGPRCTIPDGHFSTWCLR